ncbi:MAG: choice-of-anchor J domain-containing protein [Lewinellaceae bacterium]|nr:choice-of-anchor J domain-containing protein [Lewinellaceae bacterium]
MKKTLLILGLFSVLSVLIWNGCVKLEFDAPPATEYCNWQATTTIADLKALYAGADLVIQDPLIFEAVVVADDSSGNFYRSIIVQDATAGIEVRFAVTDLYNDYPVGRKVFVNCQGLTLSNYNGVLQLGEIQEALIDDHICRGPKGQVVEPKVVSIDQLDESYIHTLIKLEDVQFTSGSAGKTYAVSSPPTSVNQLLEECSSGETIILRNSGYADFVNEITPTGSGSITAIYSVYQSDRQLFIRHTRDVDMPNERCVPGIGGLLDEDFEGIDVTDNLQIAGWSNIALVGSRVWYGRSYSGNHYAEAEAYQDTNNEMDAWLITPPIDLSTPKTISFESAMAFYKHDGLSVLISTDFSGDVAAATWTALPCTLPISTDTYYEWIPSGPIDLSGYSGTAYVAFRYKGNKTSQTTKYQIDNVKVVEQ